VRIMGHVSVRMADAGDWKDVVDLFSSDGNPYGWSREKWKHYYVDYPEGEALSLVAVAQDGKVVGHYGLQPVSVGEYSAMLGMHAFVSPQFRGLTIISQLMKHVVEECRSRSVDFLIGFANPQFEQVLVTLFKWRALGYLKFGVSAGIDFKPYKERYRIKYSDEWFVWKFAKAKGPYINRYEKDGESFHQLLKAGGALEVEANEAGLSEIHFWDPALYSQRRPEGWCQGVQIKVISENVDDRILEIDNWFIEMGDSDTFEVKSW